MAICSRELFLDWVVVGSSFPAVIGLDLCNGPTPFAGRCHRAVEDIAVDIGSFAPIVWSIGRVSGAEHVVIVRRAMKNAFQRNA